MPKYRRVQPRRTIAGELFCRMTTEPFLAACKSGDGGRVRHLLQDESLIHRINAITDDDGMTPLHHACS
jgi:hypothetical protein